MCKCLTCGKEFIPSRHSSGKYCGQACYHLQPKQHEPLSDRFWRFVEKTDGCWLWQGGNDGGDGYGRIRRGSKSIGSHRASWIIHFGEIPDGFEICHKCDNPPCVRPDHLFLGSASDNQSDSWAKGRRKPPNNQGSLHGMSKLTEEQVKDIRNSYIPRQIGCRQAIARRLGISVGTVNAIIWRQRWTHI